MVHKISWRSVIFTGVILASLYFITRLLNLTAVPIFTDEAIYVRWSQIGSRDPNWRFISLTDGKQPMFTWFVMIAMQFISDPLIAGRLVSVGAGFLTLSAILLISYELFGNKRISIISGLLYIFSPFSLMYDKLALYDSLVAAFYMLSLYISILLVRYLRLDLAFILGIILGCGMLNKSSGFLSLYLLPTTLVLFDRHKPGMFLRLLRWVMLAGISAFISLMLYNILRLSPYFHIIGLKDNVFIYSFKEWFSHPFLGFTGNLRGLSDWTLGYVSRPLIIAAICSFLLRKDFSRKLLLIIWWVLPFLALALFAKVLYPRFILFMTIPLLILAAYFLEYILTVLPKTIFGAIILFVLLVPSLRSAYYVIFNPLYAPIPFADRGQLLDDWPSGWGIKEISTYLIEKSRQGRLSVYTEGTFGLLPYALEIYLIDIPGIKITGMWPLTKEPPPEILLSARDQPTYVVLNETQIPPPAWPMHKVSEYRKGRNPDVKMQLFEMNVN